MYRERNLALRADETVVSIIRPSRARHFLKVALGFCMITVNAFFTFWLWQQGIEGKIFYVIVWVLGVYLLLYGSLFNRSNFLVVTTERIFDIHRESFFDETVSALSIIDVLDVVVEQKGIFASLFNYGVLTLHPREGKFRFEIDKIPAPARVRNLLLERREEARAASRFKEKDEVYKRLVSFLPEYSEAELTLLYERVHSQLLKLAKPAVEKP